MVPRAGVVVVGEAVAPLPCATVGAGVLDIWADGWDELNNLPPILFNVLTVVPTELDWLFLS